MYGGDDCRDVGVRATQEQLPSEGLLGSSSLAPPGPLLRNVLRGYHRSSNHLINIISGPKPIWRRARDSNPRWALTHTPLAGVRLQPLGQLS